MANHPNRKLTPGVRAFLADVKTASDAGKTFAVHRSDERLLRKATLCEREGWVSVAPAQEAFLFSITDAGREIGARAGEG